MKEREPVHPMVDWSTRDGHTTAATVVVTCPACGLARRARTAAVAHAIRQASFTGRCLKDRILTGPRLGPYQPVAGVDYSSVRMLQARSRGEVLAHVRTVCVKCGAERWRAPSLIQAQLRKGTFTGMCRHCSTIATIEKNNDGRHLNSHGYVVVSKRGVALELHAAFDMAAARSKRRAGPYVAEHTVVMTAILGRALHSYETVHHRNGKRADNRPSNLRLYKRSAHHPGYGDFYHQWQEALARIRELESALHAIAPPAA